MDERALRLQVSAVQLYFKKVVWAEPARESHHPVGQITRRRSLGSNWILLEACD